MAAVVAVEAAVEGSSFFGTLLGFAGPLMIAGAIVSSGIESAVNMNDINKAVDDANNQTLIREYHPFGVHVVHLTCDLWIK